MALISLLSAKGAPGTTTTAMLLANLWPAPSLLVDADPLGGDVALRLGAEHGPLDTERGLMSLLPAARRGLEPHVVLGHAQTALGGQEVVAGLPGPEQAVAVAPLWPSLAAAFARVPDHDVFADLGQVNSRSSHLAVLEQSVAAVCVFRPSARSVVHARRRLEGLEETLRGRQIHTAVVCVAGPKETREARVAAESLLNGLPWVHDYGVVARDEKNVVMYEGGEVFRPERSLLVRSGRTVAQRLYDDLGGMVTRAGAGPDPAATEADGADAHPHDREDTDKARKDRSRRRGRKGGARRARGNDATATDDVVSTGRTTGGAGTGTTT